MPRPVLLALAMPVALSLACGAERAALPPAGVEQGEHRKAQAVAGIIAVAGALIPVAGALGLLAWIFVAWSRRRRRRVTEEIEVSAGGESSG